MRLEKIEEDEWSTAMERIALRFLYVKDVFETSLMLPDAYARKKAISLLLQPHLDLKDINRTPGTRVRLFRLFDPESHITSHVVPSIY